jgi:MtN3 and saliva related transmembrane protein
MTDIVGWTSSLLLLATIVAQIGKQWSERSGEGVSVWLFIGQAAASLGFTAYSFMVKNWVFTVTNSLMLLSALVGWQITAHFKAKSPRDAKRLRQAPQ